jgi:hypothetical protein
MQRPVFLLRCDILLTLLLHNKVSVSCISITHHVTVEISSLSAGALEFHEHGVSTLVMMSILMKSLIMQKNAIEKDTPVMNTLELPNLLKSSTSPPDLVTCRDGPTKCQICHGYREVQTT